MIETRIGPINLAHAIDPFPESGCRLKKSFDGQGKEIMALQGCLKRVNQHFGEERDFERESRAEICDRTMTQMHRRFRVTFACFARELPEPKRANAKIPTEKLKLRSDELKIQPLVLAMF